MSLSYLGDLACELFTPAIQRRFQTCSFRFAMFAFLAASLSAQTFTGSISGRVTDGTGSVVPNLAVTVTETSTGSTARTVTNEVGDYIVSFLKPGRLQRDLHQGRFQGAGAERSGPATESSLTRGRPMQVGAVSEKIEVAASAELINYTSPEVGHVVGENQLLNLPLVATNSRGRSPLCSRSWCRESLPQAPITATLTISASAADVP